MKNKKRIYTGISVGLVMAALLTGCNVKVAKEGRQEEQNNITQNDNTKNNSQSAANWDTNLATGASYEYVGHPTGTGICEEFYLGQTRNNTVAYPAGVVPIDQYLYIPLPKDKKLNEQLEIEYVETENGSMSFQWNQVPNAKEYVVFMTKYYCDMGAKEENYHHVVARTNDTSWTYLAESKNAEFCIYEVSVDEWRDETMREIYADRFVSEEKPFIRQRHFYGVVAMMEDGSWVESNLLKSEDICPKLPSKISETEEFRDCYYVENESELPETAKIIMCDGLEKEIEILYHQEEAEVKIETFINSINLVDTEMLTETKKVKEIPYTIKGTMFEGIVYVAAE